MNEEIEVKGLSFQNKDYIIVSELSVNNVNYFYVTNAEDYEKLLLKEVTIDNEVYLEEVLNDEEYMTVFKEIKEKDLV